MQIYKIILTFIFNLLSLSLMPLVSRRRTMVPTYSAMEATTSGASHIAHKSTPQRRRLQSVSLSQRPQSVRKDAECAFGMLEHDQ